MICVVFWLDHSAFVYFIDGIFWCPPMVDRSLLVCWRAVVFFLYEYYFLVVGHVKISVSAPAEVGAAASDP